MIEQSNMFEEEVQEIEKKVSSKRCKQCKYIGKKDYRSGKRFFYCTAMKCNRSGTGHKKIKANDLACWFFK